MEELIPDTVKHSVHTLVFQQQKRARDMFISEYAEPVAQDNDSESLRRSIKAKSEYGSVLEMSKTLKFRTIAQFGKKMLSAVEPNDVTSDVTVRHCKKCDDVTLISFGHVQ